MSRYFIHRKVTSSRLSLLVAYPWIFRMFMNGNFDPCDLCSKWLKNGIVDHREAFLYVVDRSTARNFMVGIKYQKRMSLCKTLSSWEQTRKATPKIARSIDMNATSVYFSGTKAIVNFNGIKATSLTKKDYGLRSSKCGSVLSLLN